MDKYKVKLTNRAYQDLNKIYRYILDTWNEQSTAEKMITLLENAIGKFSFSICDIIVLF